MARARRLAPWGVGCVVALVFCGGYLLSPLLRGLEGSGGRPYALVGLYGTELGFEEAAYAAKMREASAHAAPYDPYVRENKNWRILLVDYLSYRVMGLVHWATGYRVTATWVLLRLLCCLFWYRLLFATGSWMGLDEPAARFAATFVTCFSYLLTFIFVDYLSWSPSRTAWALLSIGRTESVLRLSRPGLVYVFLYAALLAQAKAVETGKTAWGVAAGAATGALAYVHPDVLLGAVPGLGVLTLWSRSKALWLGSAVAAAICLPFVLLHVGNDTELLARAAVVFTRQPDPATLGYLAVFAWYVARRDKEPMTVVAACLIGAVGVVVSSNLVTGRKLQFEHLKYYANVYVFLLALRELARRAAPRASAWNAAAAAVLLVAGAQSLGYAARHYPHQELPADHAAALRWLRENTAKDSVVLALSPEANLLIPVYAFNKVGFGYTVPIYSDYPLPLSTRRIRRALTLLGADEERFYRDLMASKMPDRRLIGTRSAPERDFLRPVYYYNIPEEQVRALWTGAQGQPLDFPFDYVWVGPFERDYLRRPPPFTPVFTSGEVTLYKR